MLEKATPFNSAQNPPWSDSCINIFFLGGGKHGLLAFLAATRMTG